MVNIITLCSGYDSQCMGLDKLGIEYNLVAWGEFDPESKQPLEKQPAVIAHNAVYPQYKDRNLGDITKYDWNNIKEPIDLLFYSTPCFVAGTLVLTKDGYKEIENISEEDFVLTHKNKFQKVVVPMTKRYVGQIYNINAMAFDSIQCTPEHPFYVRERYRYGKKSVRAFKEPKWLAAKDLTKDYYLGNAINTKSELPEWNGTEDNRWGHHRKSNIISDKLKTESFWYLMGRYVGDGWTRTDNTHSSVIVCCSDRNHDSLVKSVKECGFNYCEVNERTVVKIHICLKELNEFVGRFGHYAYEKRIDGETLSLPVHLLSSFLNGIIDSDGCSIGKYHKVTSVSRELIYGIEQCVAKIYHRPCSVIKTIRPHKTIIEGREVNQRDTYSISWKLSTDKQDNAFYENGYIWFPITSIDTSDFDGYVYNMEVENDNSYTANGCIVHNCQSVSIAGLQHGLKKGSGTRSSIIWNVLDAIDTLKPKYLIMENVKALVSKKFINDFNDWLKALEERGYHNEWKVLNAKNYGIPQNRERVFVVSNNVNEDYEFPKPFQLQTKLKDILEKCVDEKYYLKDETVKRINLNLNKNSESVRIVGKLSSSQNGRVIDPNGNSYAVTNGLKGEPKIMEPFIAAMRGRDKTHPSYQKKSNGNFEQMLEINRNETSNTITTVQKDNYVIEPIGISVHPNSRKLEFKGDSSIKKDVAPTLRSTDYKCPNCVWETKNVEPQVLTPKRTEYGKAIRKRYEAGEVSESRHNMTEMKPRLDGISNTITTVSKDNYLYEPLVKKKQITSDKIIECDITEENKQSTSDTIEFKGKLINNGDGLYTGTSETFFSGGLAGLSRTLKANKQDAGVCIDFRIRKLTPRECFRLMGVSEENIDKIQEAGISNSQQYKLAGNSIVVDVLYYIFKELFYGKRESVKKEPIQLSLF